MEGSKDSDEEKVADRTKSQSASLFSIGERLLPSMLPAVEKEKINFAKLQIQEYGKIVDVSVEGKAFFRVLRSGKRRKIIEFIRKSLILRRNRS